MEDSVWLRELTSDPETFKARSLTFVEGVHKMYARRQFRSAQECINLFAAAQPLLFNEEMQYTWLFHMHQMNMQKANAAVFVGRFDVARALLAATQRAILSQEITWPEHRWTAIRLARDSALASLKWLDDEAHRDMLAAPETMIQWWRESNEHIETWAKHNPQNAIGRVEKLKRCALYSSIALLKCTLRYCPERAGMIVDEVNERWGRQLTLEPAVIRVSRSRDWCFWEAAFACEAVRPEPDHSLLRYYSLQCKETSQIYNVLNDFTSYADTCDFELSVILDRLTGDQSLRVVYAITS